MKSEILKSKAVAWCAFGLVIAVLVATFSMRLVWYAFTDIFFAFMAAFTHAVAVTVRGINPVVARKLDVCAFWCCVLAIAAFIAEWFLLF